MSVFCEGADWTPGSTVLGVDVKGGEGMSLPRADETFSLPFFFGIDIRSEEEMKLGKFPKVLRHLFFFCVTCNCFLDFFAAANLAILIMHTGV